MVKKTDAGYIVINEDSVTGTTSNDAVEMISDRDGVFDIIGLDSGTYFLKETTAPDGYRRILDPIQIDVTAEFADDRNAYIEGDGALGKALTELKMTADIRQFLDGILNNDAKELVTNLEHGTGNLTAVAEVNGRSQRHLASAVSLADGRLVRRSKEGDPQGDPRIILIHVESFPCTLTYEYRLSTSLGIGLPGLLIRKTS